MVDLLNTTALADETRDILQRQGESTQRPAADSLRVNWIIVPSPGSDLPP